MLRIPQAIGFLLDFVSIFTFFQIAQILQKDTSRSFLATGISSLVLSFVDLALNSSSMILGPLVYIIQVRKLGRPLGRTVTLSFSAMLLVSISANISALISMGLTKNLVPYVTTFGQTIFVFLNILCLLVISYLAARLYVYIREKRYQRFAGISHTIDQVEFITVFTIGAAYVTTIFVTRYLDIQTVALPYIIFALGFFVILSGIVVWLISQAHLKMSNGRI